MRVAMGAVLSKSIKLLGFHWNETFYELDTEIFIADCGFVN